MRVTPNSPCNRTVFTIILAVVVLALPHHAAAQGDEFIRGYAAAVLARDFNLNADAVSVNGGVVTVRADLSDNERERVTAALREITGVERVDVVATEARPSHWSWLPRRELFSPIIGDPRWPRFSVAYQYYIDDDLLSHVAAASLGETFSLVQYDLGRYGAIQAGIQGGVFAIFDLTSDSFDLINADYFAALPVSYRTGNFSSQFRFFHQSSHLGDEYLIEEQPDRINLSYEGFDLLLAYDIAPTFRVYGGGGYLFDTDPKDLGRGSLHGGAEYVGEPFGWSFPTRPIAALDIQLHEKGGWQPNVSPVAGLQFGSGRGEQRSLRVLLEYFNGKSPNGQFFDHHIQYMALAGQLSF